MILLPKLKDVVYLKQKQLISVYFKDLELALEKRISFNISQRALRRGGLQPLS